MTDKYYKLCAALLEMASNEFSNHGCNDMPDEFFIGWTKEERQQLAKDFEDYNSGGKYYEPNHIHIPDSSLMSFFAHKLSEHSALKEQWVSVKELPKEWNLYLCYWVNDNKEGCIILPYDPKYNNWGGKKLEELKITHWQPLPAPPVKK